MSSTHRREWRTRSIWRSDHLQLGYLLLDLVAVSWRPARSARAAMAALQAERSAAVGTAVSLEVKLADARREADRERAAVVELRAALSAAEVRGSGFGFTRASCALRLLANFLARAL